MARKPKRRGGKPPPPDRGLRRIPTLYDRQRRAETRRRVLHAIALARAQDIPLTRAAKRVGTTVRSIEHYAGPMVSKSMSGRLEVKPYDRMKRPLRMLTERGRITLDVRDSRSASDLGRWWNEADAALLARPHRLQQFRGKVLRVGNLRFPYITDINVLRRLEQAGEVSFEDLYDTTR